MHSLQNKVKVFGTNRFVFAIVKHPVFGFFIDAFTVKVNEKGMFAYDYQKLTTKTCYDFFSELDEIEKQGIEIINQISDDNLQKRFNKQKCRTKDFLTALKPDFIDQFIKPFIDKNLFELAELLANNNIPLYYKGDINERILEDPIIIDKYLTTAFFRFEKQENHTLYSLRLFNNEKPLTILEQGADLIAVNPCLMLLDNKVYRFANDWDGKKLMPFFNKDSITIPKTSEKLYFQKFVLKTVKNYPVEAIGFDIDHYKGSFNPVIKIENSIDGSVVAGLYFNYGNYATFAYKDKAENHTFLTNEGDDYKFFKITRLKKQEEEYAKMLISCGLKHRSALHFETNNLDPDIEESEKHIPLLDWLIDNHELLEKKGFVIKQDFSKKKFQTLKPLISINLDEKQDWFDLKITVTFGGYSVPFIKLKDNILKGEREYVLPDGEIAILPVEWFARFKDILRYGSCDDDNICIKRHHFPLLSNLDNGKTYSKNISELHPGKLVEVPKSLDAQLRDYQLEGYRWLYFLKNNGFGGVLADDMGLGKTLQAITLLTKIYCENDENTDNNIAPPAKNEIINQGFQLDIFSEKSANNNLSPSLIVMPLSLVHNWACEIMRFSPKLRVYQHVGTGRDDSSRNFGAYDVILTTYGTLRNDIDFIKDFEFNYLILDESQVIKNAVSKVFHAVKTVTSKYRLVLTGTPIENSLTDLWSQFSFLNPGMLGSLKFFKEEYVIPIEKDKNVIKREKLKRMITPFVLRRTKDEVEKELPELTEMVHYCEMTEEQANIYEERKSEVRNFIIEKISTDGIDKSRFHILSGLMSLRLIANHPKMTDPSYEMSSGKYIEVIRSIEKLLAENHKVLVFSQFVKHLNIFKEYLDKLKITYSFLTGNTSEKDRKSIIKDFQNNSESKLFLISIKAGGVGLNLTGADYVFLLDPWWNPAVESQAINRAHRIGQHKKVFVYKFITRNTVEEKIMSLQHRKSELAGMVINSNNPLNITDVEQLQDLF
jgi:SNF2 family DNA or RNA helicase